MTVNIREYLIPESLDKRVKLTREIKAEMRKRWQEGETMSALAREYGVHRKTVYFALRRKAYEKAKEYMRERARGGRDPKTVERDKVNYKRYVNRKKFLAKKGLLIKKGSDELR